MSRLIIDTSIKKVHCVYRDQTNEIMSIQQKCSQLSSYEILTPLKKSKGVYYFFDEKCHDKKKHSEGVKMGRK